MPTFKRLLPIRRTKQPHHRAKRQRSLVKATKVKITRAAAHATRRCANKIKRKTSKVRATRHSVQVHIKAHLKALTTEVPNRLASAPAMAVTTSKIKDAKLVIAAAVVIRVVMPNIKASAINSVVAHRCNSVPTKFPT